ncbi:hypothetical protein Pelo_6413 [Pelomyxa schiedti]|nr:hypothetical protein Pelo_6413 [Pelomyxa schiedti]
MSYGKGSGGDDLLPIRDHTLARDQFVALGLGAISSSRPPGGGGWCGRRSPARALTPAALSAIGREWVVVPARLVVLQLADCDCALGDCEWVRLSVSPTLGVVHPPTMLRFERLGAHTYEVVGMVGPRPPPSPAVGDREMQLVDTTRKRYFAPETLPDLADCDTWANRRWAVIIDYGGGTMALWNFDDIENGNLTQSDWVTMDWDVHGVAEFDGDDSLVVLRRDGGGFMVIQLQDTLEQNRVVARPLEVPAGGGGDIRDSSSCIRSLLCWNGMTYALLRNNGGIVCLNTGRRTPLPEGELWPIGGPYFEVRCPAPEGEGGRGITSVVRVFSVVDPTRECCVYMEPGGSSLNFGKELVVKDTGAYSYQTNDIEVRDALSGFVICRISFKPYAVTDVL